MPPPAEQSSPVCGPLVHYVQPASVRNKSLLFPSNAAAMERISCCYIWVTKDGPTLSPKGKAKGKLWGKKRRFQQSSELPDAAAQSYNCWEQNKPKRVRGHAYFPGFLCFSSLSPLVDTQYELWGNMSCQNAARERSKIATGPRGKKIQLHCIIPC